jgi:hypothetical protein
MASSQHFPRISGTPSAPRSAISPRSVVSQRSLRSRGRRSRSTSSDEDHQYDALFPSPSRRRRSRSFSRRVIVVDDNGAFNSQMARPNFKLRILQACRQGDIRLMDKLFHDASLVPASPDELPTTDDLVLEALDAPSTGMLSAVIRRDRKYKWSDLAIIKAIEKDKAYDPPLYLDAFLYLGLSSRKTWDKEGDNHDALMWAIRSGSAEFVSMLLCAGADPNGSKVGCHANSVSNISSHG